MKQILNEKNLLYVEKYFQNLLSLLEEKINSILTDPTEALCFFFDRVFYQGRADSIKSAIDEFLKSK